ncbi:MAG: hypothetical protein WBB46_00575 [Candidatus Deferrimicrobiaceae bacterium]
MEFHTHSSRSPIDRQASLAVLSSGTTWYTGGGKIRFQQDYAQALLAEVKAMTDAYVAQTRLWRSVGIIVEKVGISIR